MLVPLGSFARVSSDIQLQIAVSPLHASDRALAHCHALRVVLIRLHFEGEMISHYSRKIPAIFISNFEHCQWFLTGFQSVLSLSLFLVPRKGREKCVSCCAAQPK